MLTGMKKRSLVSVAVVGVLAIAASLQSSAVHAASSPLLGRILLQVESRGEAWYVSPVDGKRAYLKDGPAAYQLMRSMSLGMTDVDLKKIPVGFVAAVQAGGPDADVDGLSDAFERALGTNILTPDTDSDGYVDAVEIQNGFNPLGKNVLAKDVVLINRLRGRLLLQTEGRGEVWYLNPVDGKRYYLRDGDAAYALMRSVGLGITNARLTLIPQGPTDCGDDFACVIRASETCAIANGSYVSTLGLGTVAVESRTSFQVRGFENGLCALYLRSEDINLAFADSVSADDRGIITEAYDNVIGKDALCRAVPSALARVLRRWEEGEYSTEDYDEIDCRGSMAGNPIDASQE